MSATSPPPSDSTSELSSLRKRVAELEAERAGMLEADRRQHELLERLIEASPIGIAVLRGPDHRYELANPVYRAITGSPDAPIVGLTLAEVFPEVAKEIALSRIDSVYASGQTQILCDYETTAVPGRDRSFWDVDLVPLFDAQGQVDGVLLLTSETTDHVLARRKAERLAVELEAIVDAIGDCVAVYDAEGRLVRHNRAFRELTPYGEGEAAASLAGRAQIVSVTTWDGRPLPLEQSPASLALRGQQVRSFPLALHHAGLPPIYASVTASPISDAQGEVTGAVVSLAVQNELFSLQAALEESSSRLEAIFAALSDPIVAYDASGHVLRASAAAERLFGVDLLGKTRSEVADLIQARLPDGTRLPVEQMPSARAARNQPVVDEHLLIRDGQGRERAVLASATAFANGPSGTGTVVAWRDITDLEQALARVQSVARFPEENPHPVMRFTTDGALLYANPAARALLDAWGAGGALPLAYQALLRQAATSGVSTAGETEAGEATFALDFVPVAGAGYVNLYGRDITPRRRAESERERLLAEVQEARLRAEERAAELDVAFASISDGVILTDPEGKVVQANAAARRIYGYSLEDWPKLAEGLATRAYMNQDGEPLTLVETALYQATHGETVSRQVVSFSRGGSSTTWVAISGAPVVAKDGRLTGTIQTVRDITRVKEREQERERLLSQVTSLAAGLEEQRDVLDAIVEHTGTQFAFLDPQLNFVGVNSAYAVGCGYPKEDLIGRNHFELFPDEANQAIFEHVRDSGESVRFSAKPFVFPDQPERGITYWDWTLVPVKDALGRVLGLVFSLTDVTEAMRARQRIEELATEAQDRAAELDAMIDSMVTPLAVCDEAGRAVRSNPAYREVFAFAPADEALTIAERSRLYASMSTWDGEPVPLERYPIVRALHGETVRAFPLQSRRPGMEPRWLVFTAAPIVNAGKVSGVIASAVEATELRQVQSALEQANDALAREAVRSEEAAAEAGARAAELEAIFAAIADPLIVHNAAGGIVRMNEAADRLFGFGDREKSASMAARAEITKPIHADGSPYPPGQTPGTRGLRGEVFRGEVMGVLTGAGERAWTSVSGAPILAADGSITGAVLSFTDISELRQTQERLSAALEQEQAQNRELIALAGQVHLEQARLEAIMEHAPYGISVADAEGRPVFANPTARAIYAPPLPTDSDEEHATLRFCYPEGTEYDPRQLPLTRSALDGETCHNVDMAIIWPGGPRRDLLVSTAPIRAVDGSIQGAVAVFDDVTERHSLEEERAKVNKLESLGTLAGGIAHDFNNLLVGILGNILLAKLEAEREPELEDLLSEAERAATRAKGLTQQLLTFAKGGEPIKKLVALPELISDAATFVLRGSLTVPRFAFPPSLPHVEADPGQLAQVIQNLAINAKEAMPDGGSVTLAAEAVTLGEADAVPIPPGSYVKVTVTDDGPGIPEGIRGRIFDPYFTTKPSGSGLGLSVVYSVMIRHGGYVTCGAAPGRGSQFDLYLPAAVIEPDVPAGREGAPACLGRVLVMDDEDIVLRVVTRMLRQLGCEVETAREGAEAVRLYGRAMEEGRPYTAVILDLFVPAGMGGREALDSLRQLDPGVRAIVSSGYSSNPVMARYSEYGFVGAIDKPYDFQALQKALDAALPRAR